MSKVTITYDDNDPDDAAKLIIDMQAHNAFNALRDVSEILRNHEKYGSAILTRDKFYEILGDNNIMSLYF